MAVASFAAIVLLDRTGCFGYRGDDVSCFDKKSFPVVLCLRGDAFRIALAGNREATEVIRLLGVRIPDGAAGEAAAYLDRRLTKRSVTLKLAPLPSRDRDGALPAYAYLSDSETLNAEIIRAGLALADRVDIHPMRGPFEAAEQDARRHNRGVWRDAKPATRRTPPRD